MSVPSHILEEAERVNDKWADEDEPLDLSEHIGRAGRRTSTHPFLRGKPKKVKKTAKISDRSDA